MQSYSGSKGNQPPIQNDVKCAGVKLQLAVAMLLKNDAACMDKMVLANADVARQVPAEIDGSRNGDCSYQQLKHWFLLNRVNRLRQYNNTAPAPERRIESSTSL